MSIVSYSELFKWQTCKRQYYYRFILGWSPPEENDAMVTGSKGHKLLQKFYEALREGRTKSEALEIVTRKAKELMKGKGLLVDTTLLKAWALVTNYIRQTDFNDEYILIENRFLFPASTLDADPILENVSIGFTPDLVTQRAGGWLDVEDAKFVGRTWSDDKLKRFSQIKLYQLFMEEMGYKISRTLIRFFNTEKATITTHPYVMKAPEKLILARDFMEGVKDLIKYKDGPKELLPLAPRTMNYTMCNGCAFVFVCTLEAEGKDASATLATQYVKSDYDYRR